MKAWIEEIATFVLLLMLGWVGALFLIMLFLPE